MRRPEGGPRDQDQQHPIRTAGSIGTSPLVHPVAEPGNRRRLRPGQSPPRPRTHGPAVDGGRRRRRARQGGSRQQERNGLPPLFVALVRPKSRAIHRPPTLRPPGRLQALRSREDLAAGHSLRGSGLLGPEAAGGRWHAPQWWLAPRSAESHRPVQRCGQWLESPHGNRERCGCRKRAWVMRCHYCIVLCDPFRALCTVATATGPARHGPFSIPRWSQFHLAVWTRLCTQSRLRRPPCPSRQHASRYGISELPEPERS